MIYIYRNKNMVYKEACQMYRYKPKEMKFYTYEEFIKFDDYKEKCVENIKNGEADMENCEPETYGKNGFHNPMALWNWLSENAPAEDDLTLTHGDLCLNNLILTKDGIGFFDLGKCALADRNQDIAILLRDIRHQTGIFDEEKFVRETGFAYDKEKIRWYHLLDELF